MIAQRTAAYVVLGGILIEGVGDASGTWQAVCSSRASLGDVGEWSEDDQLHRIVRRALRALGRARCGLVA
jgi:hypothetical protein